jgi:spore coat polysaccharide biosynthesis protein SpsF
MKVGILVQVRMSSTRLPGKALLPLAGAPVLERLIERLKKVGGAELIIATSTDASDNPIEELCKKTSSSVYRGDLQDVLGRFVGAAKQFNLDAVIRVTGDCPLLDPEIISSMIKEFKSGSYDYYCNIRPRTYPRGLDTEIFPVSFLNCAYAERIPEDVPEYIVIPYLNRNLQKLQIGNFADQENHSDLRWTLDEKADYDLISKIYEKLYPVKKIFNYRDVLNLLQKNPELKTINASIRQKSI